MKSIKLLAALAVPAMFAACTNEEIVVDTPLKMQEVVGEELVGTGISLNASKGNLGSRMVPNEDGTWGWADTDKLGLGWVVYNGPSTKQGKELTPDKDKLYANNLFEVEDKDGKFTTKGNIYKGWHFAYFPYAYQEEVTDNMIIDINPAVKKDVIRQDQAFYISARKFLTKDSLDADYQLAGKPFAVQNAVNSIWMRMTPGEKTAFVNGGSLDSLAVQTVTINVNAKVFTDSIKLQPHNLPADTLSNFKELLLASLYDATNPVMANNKAELETSLITDVAGAGFLTEGTNIFAAYTIPSTSTINLADIEIVVEVAGGKFTIKNESYIVGDPNEAFIKKNNEAIKALFDAYATGGSMRKVQGTVALDIVLYGEIFETDFSHITNHDEWVAAVNMVNALGRKTETFKVDSIIDFPNDSIEMPENCTLTVERASGDAGKTTEYLNVEGKIENWPSALNSSSINVQVAEGAEVKDASTIKAFTIYNYGTLIVPNGAKGSIKSVGRTGFTLVNNGTIKLGEYAKAVNVDNAGRIEVVYGSYVNLKSGTNEGIIAYNVTGDEYVWQINNLVAHDNTEGNALVNTLVVKGKTLNLNSEDDDTVGSYDPYTGAVSGTVGAVLADLSDVKIELYGGAIEGTKGGSQNVGTIEVLSNDELKESNIENVFPKEIVVTAGSTLNINAGAYETLFTNADVTVEKGATLKVNVTTYVNNVTNAGTITIADDAALYYGTQSSTGSVSGTYEKGNAATAAAEELVAAIAAAEDGDVITLNGDAELTKAIEIEKNLTIELNGFKLVNNSSDEAGESCGTTSGKACAVFYVNNSDVELTIKGKGHVEAAADDAKFNIPVWVRAAKKVTIESGNFVSAADIDGHSCHAVYAMSNCNVYITGGTFRAYGDIYDMSVVAVLNGHDNRNAKIYLSGGRYYGFGSIEAAQVGSGEVIVLNEDYEWSTNADDEGYYSVVKK